MHGSIFEPYTDNIQQPYYAFIDAMPDMLSYVENWL